MYHWDECMNANNILFSFFLSCLYFYSLLSSLLNSFIMKKKVLFGKKSHHHYEPWFYVFKDMSPRICTVYLDIFCMYVNKCCFDAMFFLTRKFQSLGLSLSAPLLARQRRRLSRCHHGCWSCDGGGSSFSLIAGLSNYKRGHHLWWIDTNRWIWGSLPMVNSIVIL